MLELATKFTDPTKFCTYIVRASEVVLAVVVFLRASLSDGFVNIHRSVRRARQSESWLQLNGKEERITAESESQNRQHRSASAAVEVRINGETVFVISSGKKTCRFSRCNFMQCKKASRLASQFRRGCWRGRIR
jgi:hypothetical protein